MKKLVIILMLVLSMASFAHRGRQDGNKGHFDRSTNKYHCHGNSCVHATEIRKYYNTNNFSSTMKKFNLTEKQLSDILKYYK